MELLVDMFQTSNMLDIKLFKLLIFCPLRIEGIVILIGVSLLKSTRKPAICDPESK